MMTVTLTRDYRITIPKAIREKLGLRPGQLVNIWNNRGIITIDLIAPDGKPWAALPRVKAPTR